MTQEKCPVCDGKIISRCACNKRVSVCENKHRFHYVFKLIKLNKYEIEIHEGLSDHFADNCKDCKVIKKL